MNIRFTSSEQWWTGKCLRQDETYDEDQATKCTSKKSGNRSEKNIRYSYFWRKREIIGHETVLLSQKWKIYRDPIEKDQQKQETDGDGTIGDVERWPKTDFDKIYDSSIKKAVDEIPKRSTDDQGKDKVRKRFFVGSMLIKEE